MTRILIVATNGFEQSELIEPKNLLEEAGADVLVASPEAGEIKGWSDNDWGESVKVDLTLDEVSAEDFDALLLPGGQMNPDILRMNEKAIDLVKQFDEARKPIAAICHAPWLLVEAGIIEGKTVTSWPSIRTDLENAGGKVVDEPAAVDGNIITSRNPGDIPAFTATLMSALEIEPANQSESEMA